MPILRLQHAVRDFGAWKAAFDSDPIHRERSGVRSHRVYRPLGDPNTIAVDLEFDTAEEARRFEVALGRLWSSAQAAAVMEGTPQVQIVEPVETVVYGC